MKNYELKYGCNPNQKPAEIFMTDGRDLPLEVLNGRPGYINFLDALNSWQLVQELKKAAGIPSAASFKHVSPTSGAIGLKMEMPLKKACFVEDIDGLDDSPLACAYARARGTDRMSSFGDWAALSDPCDAVTARIISREVSDGVIAPGFEPEALDILKRKRKGSYNIVKIDPSYIPDPIERKTVFGVTFEQKRNDVCIDGSLFENIVTKEKTLSPNAVRDMMVSLITLKYTQSNSVCFSCDGQAIGVGAGQQSRIHCTRLAGSKADLWWLRQSEAVTELPFREDVKRPDRNNAIDLFLGSESGDLLKDGAWQQYFTSCPKPFTGEEKASFLKQHAKNVTLGSDAFFPFSDNIDRGAKSGVKYVVQPGGSVRDDAVIAACDRYRMVMCFTGIRLFHH